MYKIHVENIRTRSYHGCLDEEAVIGGDYRTDVWIMLKDGYSIKNDELNQTVDYGEVSEIVFSEMKKRSKLIESVCAIYFEAKKVPFLRLILGRASAHLAKGLQRPCILTLLTSFWRS